MTGASGEEAAFLETLRTASAALERGDGAEAERIAAMLVARWPGAPGAWQATALAAERRGQWAAAAAAWARVARLAPKDAMPVHRHGLALQRAGDREGAARSLRYATILDPERPHQFISLGLAEQACGRLDAAKEAFSAAARIAPDASEPLNNLGGVAVATGDLHGAVGYYRRSIERAPDRWSGHYNLGNVLLRLDRLEEAAPALREAVRLAPERPASHANLALALLGLGEEAEGWREFLWRNDAPRAASGRPEAPLPPRLDGERLLVQNEQGIGDALFYLRYAPALIARGAEIQHEPYRKIAGPIGRIAWLRPPGESASAPTRRIPLADLPYLAEAHRGDPHPPALPLRPLPGAAEAVAARLAASGPAPYLAVTWQAGVDDGIATLKRVPPDALGAAVRGWQGTVLVIQRAPEAADTRAFASGLGRAPVDLSAFNEALEEMLALLDLAAEYVTVSNTNVHLRAGLGRASRVLVPFPPEFRWRSRDDRSPWFPDCPIYREQAAGGWAPPLSRLAADF